MDKNIAKGAGHEIKGSIKEGVGKVTGNLGLQAKGAVEKTVGKIQHKIGEGADDARAEADRTDDKLRH